MKEINSFFNYYVSLYILFSQSLTSQSHFQISHILNLNFLIMAKLNDALETIKAQVEKILSEGKKPKITTGRRSSKQVEEVEQ